MTKVLTRKLAGRWIDSGNSLKFAPYHAEFILALEAIASGEVRLAVRCPVPNCYDGRWIDEEGNGRGPCDTCRGTGWRLADQD